MRSLRGDLTADALVVGLGPAGASAAAALARAGHSVIAVDRKKEAGLPVQCAEFVPAMIGQEVGDLAVSRRQSITGMTTYVEDEAADPSPDFRGTMISRAAFDRHLVFQAMAEGASCHFAAPVREISQDGTVLVGSGARLSARVVIGADGPHSVVGSAIGQINRDCVETRQVTVPLLVPHRDTDIFLSNAIPGGYGWLFPKGASANLGLGVAPRWKRLLKPALDRLHRDLIANRRVGSEILAFTGGAIPVGGMLNPAGRLGNATVLLAGDAAGLTNPITGAGISAAVMSGTMAGRAAAAMLDGDAHAAEGYREELEDIFGPALRRACNRRRRLMSRYSGNAKPTTTHLREAWIAYPQYWAA